MPGNRGRAKSRTVRPGAKRGLVTWICIGVAAVLAALIAVFALSGQASPTAGGNPLLGKSAPMVSGHSLEGRSHFSLSQLSGKWVLVNFAASWCVPCRQELPQLLEFSRRESTSHATILTVDFSQGDGVSLGRLLTQVHAGWPAVWDVGAASAFGVKTLPESFLVDPEGTVVASIQGGVEARSLEAMIARYSSGTHAKSS